LEAEKPRIKDYSMIDPWSVEDNLDTCPYVV